MQSPREPYLDIVKRILKYMNSTLDLGLFYEKDIYLELYDYADANLGGDLNSRR